MAISSKDKLWSDFDKKARLMFQGQYKEARGNSELQNEILAEVKLEILQQAAPGSVALPNNLRVAIRRVFLPELDPEDQDDEENIILHILSVSEKRKEDAGEGEHVREERARPTKAGDYRKPFTAFTCGQRLFKDDLDLYDRERRDTKDPKTIGQRTKIVQKWWESLSDDRKAEAGRAAEKWNKLGAPKETHDLYQRKNFPSMAREFIDTVQRTMGCHIVMFSAHEAGENQIKMTVFETPPADGKKAFTKSSESSKDWVLNREYSLTDYLLTAPVEEEDLKEKQEVEITVDEDGNPEVPSWSGQKLKVHLWWVLGWNVDVMWLVEGTNIAKFTERPKAKVPWGLLIKSPLEYLDKESIPDGFTMKDPSKWTKADSQLLWTHWHSLEGEDKVIVSFINCRKEDAPLAFWSDRKGKASSKKKVYMSPGDDSEASVGPMGMVGGSDSKQETGGVPKRGEVVPGRAKDDTPQETSPAWHASKDRVKFLKSLSIMPWYQELVELVLALPKTAPGMGTKLDMPVWATWAWSAQYLSADIHMDGSSFWKALGKLQSARFGCSLKGLQVVLGFGLLLRECKWAQEVEPDDPEVADLDFLLNSELGVERGEDVMDAVGLVVSRLQQNSSRMGEQERGEGIGGKGGCRVGEEMSGNEGGSEEEETPVPRPMKKRKREGSVNLKWKQKVTKGGHHEDEVQGEKIAEREETDQESIGTQFVDTSS
ncbi:hypothetical protein EDC04DRAFT_2609412 [Pisolithus marmoratus]|nr:hypothetical protein EDC04DRAFT_2609412 [Pisolithus marmoratus]